VEQFRYLGMTVTNQKLVQEEIERKLNLVNACYHSVQELSENIKIRTYKTTVLFVVLYECETSPVTLREEHRLRVFENKVLRIFVVKRDEVTGGWRKLYNELVLFTKYN
jgi:ribosomal protein S6